MAGSAAPSQSGIMSWVSTIRTAMANDPGRQDFENLIQSNGFLFLEEYLDNILAGPKNDPIIELCKTPGRKKDISKKTRAATAALNKSKMAIANSWEDEEFDKENHAPRPVTSSKPVNAFHEALLQASRTDEDVKPDSSRDIKPLSSTKTENKSTVTPVKPPSSPEPVQSLPSVQEEERLVENLVTPPPEERSAFTKAAEGPEIVASVQLQQLAPPFATVQDLSMIAEDEEPIEGAPSMRTAVSPSYLSPAHMPHHSFKPSTNYRNLEVMDIDDFSQTINFGPASTSDSARVDAEGTTETNALEPQDPSPNQEQTTISSDEIVNIEESESESRSLFDAGREEPKSSDLSSKSHVLHFPTIGAPSPLRKSTRVPPERALSTAPQVVSVSGFSNQRSSWLVKAREAKASEDNIKRKSAFAPSLPHPNSSLAVKRKSGDLSEPNLHISPSDSSEEPKSKIAKTDRHESLETDKITSYAFHGEVPKPRFASEDVEIRSAMHDQPEGMIDRLKKTVEGFSSRAGKSMGKGVKEAAVTALAEAKAAAEAKVAERTGSDIKPSDAKPDSPLAVELTKYQTDLKSQPQRVFTAPLREPVFSKPPASQFTQQKDKRLSVSDLVSKYETQTNENGLVSTTAFHPQSQTTTIEPQGPTAPSAPPPHNRSPVFKVPESSKAQQTFLPSVTLAQSLASQYRAFDHNIFSLRPVVPLSAQSTLSSAHSSQFSDTFFDHDIPSWMPSTQETEVDQNGGSQSSQNVRYEQLKAQIDGDVDDMDADESWHLDDKFAESWSPVPGVGIADDSMTWSTNPSFKEEAVVENTRKEDRASPAVQSSQLQGPPAMPPSPITLPPPTFDDEPFDEGDEVEDMDVIDEDDVAGQIRLIPSASQSTTSLASSQNTHYTHSRSNSQLSVASSQNGFFSAASKLVSSVLGTGKKTKTEPLKSIQLAAAAAKKQQQEAERKAARLKDMEARRQQALQKKVDEDKAREEKRVKEEADRRRREKEKEENTTEKRAIRQPGKKLAQIEEDLAKKRKIDFEKKPPSKDKKDNIPPKIGKPEPGNSQGLLNASAGPSKNLKAGGQPSNLVSSSIKLVSSSSESRVMLPPPVPMNSKGKGKAIVDDDLRQPSQVMQAQMQARLQAQLEEARKVEIPPPIPSESIELPDINSEYSDSDDEDRKKRAVDLPEWAQSPELRDALLSQRSLNPDDIFGAIKPLKMEELFKTRTSRFRARTSSANWSGTDGLTAAEVTEYARRMGYTK